MWSFALLCGGYSVGAVDLVEPPLVERLVAFGQGRYEFAAAADPVTLPFDDASFDAVTSCGVLEHVRETGGAEDKSLSEIARVLKPGGHFVCCHFPNRLSWIDAVATRTRGLYSHPFKYDRHDIERLAADAGLQLRECRRYGALPRNMASRLPRRLADTPSGASLFDALDAGLGAIARPLCQNYLWVARRAVAG